MTSPSAEQPTATRVDAIANVIGRLRSLCPDLATPALAQSVSSLHHLDSIESQASCALALIVSSATERRCPAVDAFALAELLLDIQHSSPLCGIHDRVLEAFASADTEGARWAWLRVALRTQVHRGNPQTQMRFAALILRFGDEMVPRVEQALPLEDALSALNQLLDFAICADERVGHDLIGQRIAALSWRRLRGIVQARLAGGLPSPFHVLNQALTHCDFALLLDYHAGIGSLSAELRTAIERMDMSKVDGAQRRKQGRRLQRLASGVTDT